MYKELRRRRYSWTERQLMAFFAESTLVGGVVPCEGITVISIGKQSGSVSGLWVGIEFLRTSRWVDGCERDRCWVLFACRIRILAFQFGFHCVLCIQFPKDFSIREMSMNISICYLRFTNNSTYVCLASTDMVRLGGTRDASASIYTLHCSLLNTFLQLVVVFAKAVTPSCCRSS